MFFQPTPALSVSSGPTDLKKREPGGTVLPTEQPARWHDADWASYMWNSVCTLLEHNTGFFFYLFIFKPSTLHCSGEDTGRRTPAPRFTRGGGRQGPCMFKMCVIGWAVKREHLHSSPLTHHFPWPWLTADSHIWFWAYFLPFVPAVTLSGLHCVFNHSPFSLSVSWSSLHDMSARPRNK